MARKIIIAGITLLFLAGAVFAQVDKKRVEDAFHELDTDEMTLRFHNALNGEPIVGAEIIMAEKETFVTDSAGKFTRPMPEDGYYSVDFSKKGFISATFEIEIAAGTLVFNQISVSPDLPLGHIRIVVDWGRRPADLDAHLVKRGGYHISYHQMKKAKDGGAKLDRDDRTGLGPETITISKVDGKGEYTYYIHDYSNRLNKRNTWLSNSNAHVKVFGNNQLLHVYRVPAGKKGTYWPVLKILDGGIRMIEQELKTKM